MHGTRTIQPLFLLFHEKAGITDIACITRLTCWTAAQSRDTLASFLFVGRHAGCGYMSILRFSRDTQPVHARPEAGRHVWTNIWSRCLPGRWVLLFALVFDSPPQIPPLKPPQAQASGCCLATWLTVVAPSHGTIAQGHPRLAQHCAPFWRHTEQNDKAGLGNVPIWRVAFALPCWLTRSGL